MQRWYKEDWGFSIEVLSVGKENKCDECRMGFECGDKFECTYECPSNFCSKSMLKVFPIFEAVRSGGSLANLGGNGPYEMDIICPDGVVKFKIIAREL